MLKTILMALLICILEFLVIVIASPLAKPSLVLSFLPKDIREKGKSHPEPSVWKQLIGHFLLIVMVFCYLFGFIYVGKNALQDGCGYWQITLRYLVMLYVIKAFDIIVQDQWLVMTSGYYKKLYPETADCAGWKDRSFNTKNQIKRLILFPFAAMLTGGIVLLFK